MSPADDQFHAAVRRTIKALRRGEVTTYGEVAAEAGYPGAARAVGRILATADDDLPWWRVVAANGRLVPGHEQRHAELLEKEGVPVAHGRVKRTRAGRVR